MNRTAELLNKAKEFIGWRNPQVRVADAMKNLATSRAAELWNKAKKLFGWRNPHARVTDAMGSLVIEDGGNKEQNYVASYARINQKALGEMLDENNEFDGGPMKTGDIVDKGDGDNTLV